MIVSLEWYRMDNQEKKNAKAEWWIAASLLLTIPFLVWSLFFSSDRLNTSGEITLSPQVIAQNACRDSIRRSLHDPRSVEWGPLSSTYYRNWSVQYIEANDYRVVARFRAANALGATVMNSALCRVRVQEERGTIVELTFM